MKFVLTIYIEKVIILFVILWQSEIRDKFELCFCNSALVSSGGREIKMSEIRIKDHESLDSALRRFKRSCAKDGVLSEIRKREHYEKPSVKRKKKSEAARKRKFK